MHLNLNALIFINPTSIKKLKERKIKINDLTST